MDIKYNMQFQHFQLHKLNAIVKRNVMWLSFVTSCGFPTNFAQWSHNVKVTNGDHMTMGCCDIIIVGQLPGLCSCDCEVAATIVSMRSSYKYHSSGIITSKMIIK